MSEGGKTETMTARTGDEDARDGVNPPEKTTLATVQGEEAKEAGKAAEEEKDSSKQLEAVVGSVEPTTEAKTSLEDKDPAERVNGAKNGQGFKHLNGDRAEKAASMSEDAEEETKQPEPVADETTATDAVEPKPSVENPTPQTAATDNGEQPTEKMDVSQSETTAATQDDPTLPTESKQEEVHQDDPAPTQSQAASAGEHKYIEMKGGARNEGNKMARVYYDYMKMAWVSEKKMAQLSYDYMKMAWVPEKKMAGVYYDYRRMAWISGDQHDVESATPEVHESNQNESETKPDVAADLTKAGERSGVGKMAGVYYDYMKMAWVSEKKMAQVSYDYMKMAWVSEKKMAGVSYDYMSMAWVSEDQQNRATQLAVQASPQPESETSADVADPRKGGESNGGCKMAGLYYDYMMMLWVSEKKMAQLTYDYMKIAWVSEKVAMVYYDYLKMAWVSHDGTAKPEVQASPQNESETKANVAADPTRGGERNGGGEMAVVYYDYMKMAWVSKKEMAVFSYDYKEMTWVAEKKRAELYYDYTRMAWVSEDEHDGATQSEVKATPQYELERNADVAADPTKGGERNGDSKMAAVSYDYMKMVWVSDKKTAPFSYDYMKMAWVSDEKSAGDYYDYMKMAWVSHDGAAQPQVQAFTQNESETSVAADPPKGGERDGGGKLVGVYYDYMRMAWVSEKKIALVSYDYMKMAWVSKGKMAGLYYDYLKMAWVSEDQCNGAAQPEVKANPKAKPEMKDDAPADPGKSGEGGRDMAPMYYDYMRMAWVSKSNVTQASYDYMKMAWVSDKKMAQVAYDYVRMAWVSADQHHIALQRQVQASPQPESEAMANDAADPAKAGESNGGGKMGLVYYDYLKMAWVSEEKMAQLSYDYMKMAWVSVEKMAHVYDYMKMAWVSEDQVQAIPQPESETKATAPADATKSAENKKRGKVTGISYDYMKMVWVSEEKMAQLSYDYMKMAWVSVEKMAHVYDYMKMAWVPEDQVQAIPQPKSETKATAAADATKAAERNKGGKMTRVSYDYMKMVWVSERKMARVSYDYMKMVWVPVEKMAEVPYDYMKMAWVSEDHHRGGLQPQVQASPRPESSTTVADATNGREKNGRGKLAEASYDYMKMAWVSEKTTVGESYDYMKMAWVSEKKMAQVSYDYLKMAWVSGDQHDGFWALQVQANSGTESEKKANVAAADPTEAREINEMAGVSYDYMQMAWVSEKKVAGVSYDYMKMAWVPEKKMAQGSYDYMKMAWVSIDQHDGVWAPKVQASLQPESETKVTRAVDLRKAGESNGAEVSYDYMKMAWVSETKMSVVSYDYMKMAWVSEEKGAQVPYDYMKMAWVAEDQRDGVSQPKVQGSPQIESKIKASAAGDPTKAGEGNEGKMAGVSYDYMKMAWVFGKTMTGLYYDYLKMAWVSEDEHDGATEPYVQNSPQPEFETKAYAASDPTLIEQPSADDHEDDAVEVEKEHSPTPDITTVQGYIAPPTEVSVAAPKDETPTEPIFEADDGAQPGTTGDDGENETAADPAPTEQPAEEDPVEPEIAETKGLEVMEATVDSPPTPKVTTAAETTSSAEAPKEEETTTEPVADPTMTEQPREKAAFGAASVDTKEDEVVETTWVETAEESNPPASKVKDEASVDAKVESTESGVDAKQTAEDTDKQESAAETPVSDQVESPTPEVETRELVFTATEAAEVKPDLEANKENANLGKEDTNTSAAKVLILISRQSLMREVVANQHNAMTILDGLSIMYDTVDGADPANKSRRNELFGISGIRARYPQFFIRDGDKTTFWGDWDAFQNSNELGALSSDLGGGPQAETHTPANATAVEGQTMPIETKKTDETDTTDEPSANLLILLSKQSMMREVVANQAYAMTILDGLSIKYTTVDGSDQANKARRNELFEISGIRARYPQFFLVDGDKTTFWGDWDAFHSSNERGSISSDLGSDGTQVEKDVPIATATENPKPPRSGNSDQADATNDPSVKLLILLSKQSLMGEVVKNQENALAILDGLSIKYKTVDGSDPSNKARRNKLFEISGVRSRYPQFFILDGTETTFWGDWDTFQSSNERGSVGADLGSLAMDDDTQADKTTPSSESVINSNQSGSLNGGTDQESHPSTPPRPSQSARASIRNSDIVSRYGYGKDNDLRSSTKPTMIEHEMTPKGKVKDLLRLFETPDKQEEVEENDEENEATPDDPISENGTTRDLDLTPKPEKKNIFLCCFGG